MKKTIYSLLIIMMIGMGGTAEAAIDKEKRTGAQTAAAQQRKTVKAGKRTMRGLRKASHYVNKKLSETGRGY